MADDRTEIRHINWTEVFSFTHIFKSFRLAIHPSKLLLAFMAIALTWLIANGMSMVWKLSSTEGYVAPNEITAYARMDKGFDEARQKWLDGRPSAVAALQLDARDRYIEQFEIKAIFRPGAFKTAYDELIGKKKPDPSKDKLDDLITAAKKDLGKSLKDANEAAADRAALINKDALDSVYKQAARNIDDGKDLPDKVTKDDARKQLDEDYDRAIRASADQRDEFSRKTEQVSGQGIWDAFADYEWGCVYNSVVAVANGDIFKGLPLNPRPVVNADDLAAAPVDKGFLAWVVDALRGVAWLLTQHIVFGVILLLVVLAIWALLGGAIHRIAALHAARDEKISIFQALRFSLGKWPSFFTAPLIPLAVIFFFGSFIILGGLAGNLWGFGSVLLGVMLLLAILLGMFIAFITVGLVTGFGLMYPTIAVEGSDSFDAISRSFAYIYARPWRAGVYSLVGLVYGVICYLFVRLFGFIALASTHEFLRWGCWQGGQSVGASDKVAAIWQAPTFAQLLQPVQWAYLDGWEKIGAIFAWIWVALIVGLVNAFLLTFFSSCNTVVYLLLRRKVDATDLDDVFVQESAEKPLADQPAVTPATPAPAAPPTDSAPPTAPTEM